VSAVCIVPLYLELGRFDDLSPLAKLRNLRILDIEGSNAGDLGPPGI